MSTISRIYRAIDEAKKRLALEWSERASAAPEDLTMSFSYGDLLAAEEKAFERGFDRGRKAGYLEHKIEEANRRSAFNDDTEIAKAWKEKEGIRIAELGNELSRGNGDVP